MTSLDRLAKFILYLIGTLEKILLPVVRGGLGSGLVLNCHVELSYSENIFIGVESSIAPGYRLEYRVKVALPLVIAVPLQLA